MATGFHALRDDRIDPLRFECARFGDGRLDVETISGDVRIDLAKPLNVEFDVSSFSGDIRNCFGPKPARTDEYGPGKELRFTEGKGLARVRVKALSGDVSICNL